jgi:protein-tyrosine phosphatase
MAEAIFRAKVTAAGLSEMITTDSAGTGDWHIGSEPHHGTIDMLRKHNLSHEGLYARQVKRDDFHDFQYIVCMDSENVRNVQSFAVGEHRAAVVKMLDFYQAQPLRDVPDPYFTGNFTQTYALLDEACEQLLAFIVSNNIEKG